MISLYDVLKASKGFPANDPIAGIWGKKLAGGKIQETEGTLPLTINANGEPLIDYKIYGNTTQNGTPDPQNPVDAVGCGVRTEIPYGYKLPATTTNGADTVITPVYIGAEPLHRISEYADYVDYTSGKIVRKIKKLVLTGEEEWAFVLSSISSSNSYFRLPIAEENYGVPENSIGTHFTNEIIASSTNMTGQRVFNALVVSPSTRMFSLVIRPNNVSSMTVTSFKQFLAQQYANGTPVTVWYVLATPVEEDPPVALPALPTLDGTTVYDADLITKPSKMYVKYRKHGT